MRKRNQSLKGQFTAACVFIAVTGAAAGVSAFADSGSPASSSGGASSTGAQTGSGMQSVHDARSDTLLYGIDSQILDLLKTLTQEKDGSLDAQVESIFQTSNNPDVRNTALTLLDTVKDWSAAPAAEKIVEDYLNTGTSPSDTLVITSIRYLRDAQDKQAVPALTKLVDDRSTAVASEAVGALGTLGDQSASAMLIQKVQDDNYPLDLKAQAILSIGDLKPKDAVPVLTKILQNPDADITLRRYACDALGKIGDPESIGVIQTALGDSDTYLRAYAVNALAQYPGAKVDGLITEALKDSFWRVRVAAADTLGDRKVTDAVPILEYKAKNDPETNVQSAAIGALGKIGGGDVFHFLQTMFANSVINPTLRIAAMDALADNDLHDSLPTFQAVVEKEWTTPESKMLDPVCKRLSEAKDPGLESFFAKFLTSTNLNIEIYGLRGIAANHFTDLLKQVEAYNSPKAADAVHAAAETAAKALQ